MGLQYVKILQIEGAAKQRIAHALIYFLTLATFIGEFNFFIVRGSINLVHHLYQKECPTYEVLQIITKTTSFVEMLIPFFMGVFLLLILHFLVPGNKEEVESESNSTDLYTLHDERLNRLVKGGTVVTTDDNNRPILPNRSRYDSVATLPLD